MYTFIQRPKLPHQKMSAKSTIQARTHVAQGLEVNSILYLQRMVGNQAVRRLLQTKPDDLEAVSDLTAACAVPPYCPLPASANSCRVALNQDVQPWFAPSGEGCCLDVTLPKVSGHAHGLTRVRVHTDGESARTAHLLNAQAYTLGAEVAFAAGRFQPQTPAGRVLLSHEIGHVLQRAGGCAGIQRQIDDPSADRDTPAVQRLIRSAIEEIDTENPSYKVLLRAWILADKHSGLKQFGLALAERSHPQYGTYLNGFLVYLHARGSDRIAEMVVAGFNKAGLRLLKSGEQPQDDKSLPGATGAGLGSILTYEGKTLVKIGGTDFYISGKPPDYWKGKTTSVLFLVNKNQPKKMYRLDFDVLKEGPKAGVKGWEHNQKGVAKVLGLKVTNHQPAGGWARAAGRAIQLFKWGGRALFILGVGSEVVEIYYALDRTRAVLGAVASLGGIFGGALAGASAGGRLPGPWPVKVGGVLIGGVLGGWIGSKVAKSATQMAYDYFVTPLDQEEWFAFDESQVELPRPETAP